MPSWRKVILSGSDAALNTLSVSNSITASVISASQFTGSLFGTSSWAIRAVSSSYLSGSTAIVNNLTVNNNLFWDSTPNSIAGFASSSGYLLATSIKYYNDNTLFGRPVSLRVGELDPEPSQPSGSHILKDGRELFTNAKAAEPNEPFIILGFGGKNAITLDTDVGYQHVGIDDYDNFIAGEVYAGSLKIRKTLYGITEADTGTTKLYSDGFVIPPSSPGFVLGDGGFYMFESNSMQFNPSGALLSPVASASIKFTIAPDSSSLSISVGKNDLREMLFISRSGNSPRIGIGKSSSGAALDVNGSVIVTGSLGMSGDLTTSQISASNTVRLSGAILELPNLSVGTTGNYNNLLIVDSVGRVRTLPTGSVPYIEVGSGVLPTNQALVMFTGSTGDIANAIGITYSSVFGWSFFNAGTSYDASIPNLFTSNLLAVNVTSSIISSSGGITGSNLSINGFPNVSASLASLASGVGTLQQVTDAGNTTSNAISSSFPGVGFFGTASWAINVVNGGGGGGGGSDSAFLNQSTAATTWSFAHNLGTQYPVITVYDTSGQVIIPQEIDGEDTNNLKIYFPTSQSGYATAVGGTSALTYYSQSLTTASVNLNTITFTKGDSSTFNITVNTGSSTITSSFALTASYVNSLRQDVIITGSTYITGGFEALGNKGSKIQLGTYNVGYDIGGLDTLYITGAGLIISGNMPDQNHHNFLKIGNVELVDVNTAFTSNEFLIHNVNTLRITSGADGGNITTNNQLLKIGGGQFYVYRAGSGDSSGIIQSNGNTTKITDTVLDLFGQSGSYFYIPSTNEITTLNGTDYLMGFVTDPSSPGSSLTNKIKADKFIWATGSNQIISGGLIITGSTNSSGGFTGSLFGTSSWATNALTASYILNAVSSSFALTSSLANRNILTASVSLNTITFTKGDGTTFPITVNTGSGGGGSVGTLQQVTEQGASTTVPITASIISASSFTGSLFGTASWALNVVGGGSGVTINNNVDNYLITATGTANTLNGEVGLQYSGSILINASRSQFGGAAVADTTHQFRGLSSDTYAGFLIQDPDGEDIFKTEGSIANSTLGVYIGDFNNVSNGTAITIDVANDDILLRGKLVADNTKGITGSLFGTASLASRNILTASVSSNTITFTKGDNTTFNLTINTGSGGGGSVGTLAQVTALGASTTVPITASIISASSFTGSLFGTASWANNVLTSSFVNNLNQNLSITGAVILSGSALPELRIIGETQFTGSVGSTGGFTGSLLGTSSWANNARTASFLPVGTYSITSSWATNALTASFVNNLNQNLAITGAVILSGSALPELRVIGDSQFTGSIILSGSVSTIGTTSMTGSLVVSTNITASRTFLSGSVGTVSGSTLTVYGSGSAQPVFTVQGSSGELFSVTDSLTGSLFSVNDISGLPILEVFSDNSVLIGSYLDPMLVSTAKVTQTNSGSFTVYSLPTASYDTAFFEYSVRSGSNARVGTIMAIQSASSVNFMETTASQFGSTSAISFTVIITGSNMALTGSSTTGSWTIKTIVRGI